MQTKLLFSFYVFRRLITYTHTIAYPDRVWFTPSPNSLFCQGLAHLKYQDCCLATDQFLCIIPIIADSHRVKLQDLVILIITKFSFINTVYAKIIHADDIHTLLFTSTQQFACCLWSSNRNVNINFLRRGISLCSARTQFANIANFSEIYHNTVFHASICNELTKFYHVGVTNCGCMSMSIYEETTTHLY
jgi:hypothetical protein